MLLVKILVAAAILLVLHQAPVWQGKIKARSLIHAELGRIWPSQKDFDLRVLRDSSNYRSLFDISAFVPTGGNEEYYNLCVVIGRKAGDRAPTVDVFRAVGDRKRNEMRLHKVVSGPRCLSDQAG